MPLIAFNLIQIITFLLVYILCFSYSSIKCEDHSQLNNITIIYSIRLFLAEPGTPYQVRVVAFTSVGMGALGDYVVFFSQELIPTKPPENVTVIYISGTSINVTWTPLSLFEAQGFPQYKVTILPTTESRQRRQSDPISVITTNSYAVFEDLDSNTKYSVEVGVTNSVTDTVVNSKPVEGMFIYTILCIVHVVKFLHHCIYQ